MMDVGRRIDAVGAAEEGRARVRVGHVHHVDRDLHRHIDGVDDVHSIQRIGSVGHAGVDVVDQGAAIGSSGMLERAGACQGQRCEQDTQ